MATTTTTSKQFNIGWSDVLKGVVTAFLTAFVTSIYTWINAGSFPTADQFKTAALIGLGAGLSYLIKNFFTPSAIVVKDVPQQTIEDVKSGDATVKVISQ